VNLLFHPSTVERVGFLISGQSEVGRVTSADGVTRRATRPEKTGKLARAGRGLEPRKRWLHQGL